jgi:hypothetical protein
MGGTNFTSTRAIYLRGTDNSNGAYSSTGVSFQFGAAYRRYLTPKFDLSIEGIYLQTIYQSVIKDFAGVNSTTFQETQGRIEIPLTTIYTPVKWGKFSPYLRAGFNTSYLISDAGTWTTYMKPNNESKPATTTISNITDKRIPLEFWGIIGGGIGFNFTKSCLMLDFRYYRGFNTVDNPKKQFAPAYLETIFTNRVVENDFKMDNMFISLSYFYKLYKPEKKKLKK